MKHYTLLFSVLIIVLLAACKKDEDNREIDDKIINDYLQQEKLTANKQSQASIILLMFPAIFLNLP